ncbi:interleukin-1 receptor type 1-like isoform X2 [Hemibagrus wyckioides]|uniref:interleukin-1 receptor type 1-like isoform X2 n=1 Tax=Hemibagrus wyckioides TaxID=337641 RepID=UPI00266CB80F|nr:interleukin-1 receptor type 1-like isoform X2 [Hemibagrus wyckioides]
MAGVLIVLKFLMNLIFLVSASTCTERQVEATGIKGQATIIFCDSDLDNESSTFTWTKDNRTLEPSPQITMQGQILWLLNTTSSDGGLYVCRSSNSTFSTEIRVILSVEAGPCRSFSEIDLKQEKDNIKFSCSEERVPVLGETLEVQWWKDCKSTGIRGSELNLFNVSMSSKGNYTCMVIFRYEDKNYTASLTYQLEVMKKEIVINPQVLEPRDKTLYVKPGMSIKLECNLLIGIGEDCQQETSVYWMINHSYAMMPRYPDLQQNLTTEMRENSWLYGRSTLFIPEILPEFFGIPFQCVILNPNGNDIGQVWLSQDDYMTHIWLIIAVLPILAVIVGAVLLNFFKIDLILAYRHLCGKDKNIHEGNQYNAFVLYLHGKRPGSSTVEDFALRILPSMLEQQHNLKLFIHGRDTDTEASIASISDVLSQSKAVMLILPGSTEDETLIPLSQDQNRLEDSQLSVLFSDISDSGVPLLLVESGENADYSLLPESIQSSIKKGRVLKWKPTVQPDGRFWKQLRYHMT